MAKQTTHPVKFKYSRAVKKGRISKFKGREQDRQTDELFNESWRSQARVRTSEMVDGGILQTRISKFRHWFSFLKLALEMQEQEAVLIYKKKEHKIKVNKSMYVGWDLDKVLTSKFDDWFFKQNHRTLFLSDITRVLKTKDKVSSAKNKITIEFDANRRITDVIKDIRRLGQEENVFNNDSDDINEEFVINGRVIDSVLQNRFNALLLKLEGKLSNEEIITHKNNYIRATSKSQEIDGIKGYSTQLQGKGLLDISEDAEYLKSIGASLVQQRQDKQDAIDRKLKTSVKEPNWAYTINELIHGSKSTTGAKTILLSVCDGHFLKNPNKTYT